MIYATLNQDIFENFCSRPVWTIQNGKESKTSAAETAGDGSSQIQASAEIRRVSELLAMATNGRRAKVTKTTLSLTLLKMNLWFLLIICDFCGSARAM